MSRSLENFRPKGLPDDGMMVDATDDPGHGGAHHRYTIDHEDNVVTAALGFVSFQNGPIQEVGVNGVQNEHLLAIVEDRLACFQAGPFASSYNQEALIGVRDALAALHRRTADRQARNVEGMNAP